MLSAAPLELGISRKLVLARKGEILNQKMHFFYLPPVLPTGRVNICIGKGVMQFSYSEGRRYHKSCSGEAIDEQ